MGEAARKMDPLAADVQAYTVAEFCRTFSIGKTTVYKEIKEGRLRSVKAGARTLIPASSAREWFESLPQGRAA